MADRQTVWCLGSCNVALLTVVGVLSLHAFADLGDLLDALDTGTGLALSLALWALTLWSNDRALAGVWKCGDAPRPGLRTLAIRALVWGAATGVGFLWTLVLLVYLPDAPGLAVVLREGPELVGIVLFGSIFAALVGAVLGLLVGALDLLLLRTARAIGGE